jgi:hypothetical protein
MGFFNDPKSPFYIDPDDPYRNHPLRTVQLPRNWDGVTPFRVDDDGNPIEAVKSPPRHPPIKPVKALRRQPRLPRRRAKLRHLHIEPADTAITRLFTELQQRRSPQHERYVFARIMKRVLTLPRSQL